MRNIYGNENCGCSWNPTTRNDYCDKHNPWREKMKVKVTQPKDEKEQVPVEVLATSIRAIAAGIKNLRKGPLGERALILLIQDNCHMNKGYRRKKVNISTATIKSVLESIESLQSTYLSR